MGLREKSVPPGHMAPEHIVIDNNLIYFYNSLEET